MQTLGLCPNADLLQRANSRGGSTSQKEAFELAKQVAREVGISRVSEIGNFADRGISICQTSRPRLEQHYKYGMNSGGQGKGYDFHQAYISAVMETAEAFCAEPRNPNFVRASYNELVKWHAVAPPKDFLIDPSPGDFRLDEPMLWTWAIEQFSERNVLIPADLVYLFAFPEHYNCANYYHSTSAGLGAGFDLSSALRTALLEVIEHSFLSRLNRNETRLEAFHEDDPVVSRYIRRLSREFRDLYDTHFFSVTNPHFTVDIPFIKCVIATSQGLVPGTAADVNPLRALEKAHLEAFQGWATVISGARENVIAQVEVAEGEVERLMIQYPDESSLGFEDFKNRFRRSQRIKTKSTRPSYATQSEADVQFLLRNLRQNGVDQVYLVNLSRKETSFKVVKAVIPGLIDLRRRPPTAPKKTYAQMIREQFIIPQKR